MNRQAQSATSSTLSRRAFFRISAMTGVGLTIGIYLPPRPSNAAPAQTASLPAEPQAATEFVPNIYVTLDPSGTVTVNAFRVEMGQGIRTALGMIVAEELDVAWENVRIAQVGADDSVT